MTELIIHCDVIPFSVPHFQGTTVYTVVFPTKLDFLIADCNDDGIIDETDRSLWNDRDMVRDRISDLCARFDPSYSDERWYQDQMETLLYNANWWKDNDAFQITGTLDWHRTLLQWHMPSYELELQVPDRYMSLFLTTKHMREHLRQLETFFFQHDSIIAATYYRLYETLLDELQVVPAFRSLEDRIDHLERTYVRL